MRAAFLLVSLLLPALTRAQAQVAAPVPGTHVRLVPPPGFTAATAFTGFEQAATGASILVAELPAPVQQLTAGMNEAALAAKGMKLLQRQSVDLHGTPATLLRVTQPAHGQPYQKLILLCGDATRTVLVTAAYPEARPGSAAPLRAALLTTVYDARPAAAAPAAPFIIHEAGTGFRLAQSLAGSLLYSTDGTPTPRGPDQAAFIVGASVGAVDVQAADQEQYCLLHLRQVPSSAGLHVRPSEPVTIDGLDGYEIVADGRDAQGRPQLVYQVMLFAGTDRYYRLVGLTDNHLDEHLAAFQTLARSFRRR